MQWRVVLACTINGNVWFRSIQVKVNKKERHTCFLQSVRVLTRNGRSRGWKILKKEFWKIYYKYRALGLAVKKKKKKSVSWSRSSLHVRKILPNEGALLYYGTIYYMYLTHSPTHRCLVLIRSRKEERTSRTTCSICKSNTAACKMELNSTVSDTSISVPFVSVGRNFHSYATSLAILDDSAIDVTIDGGPSFTCVIRKNI